MGATGRSACGLARFLFFGKAVDQAGSRGKVKTCACTCTVWVFVVFFTDESKAARRSMITIKEIARLAGVSRGTVDRVLNKRGGVDKAVEARVNGIVGKHGYRPNRLARALVNRKRLYTIGVISASSENVFFKDVVDGIRKAEEEVKESGVSLCYGEVARFRVADQARRIDEMVEKGIDALAINPINAPEIRGKLQELQRRGMPIITFNSDIEGVEKLAYIGCDYLKTGRIAAGLVAYGSGGRANVCVVAGSMSSLGHSLRVEGFAGELKRFRGMRIVETVEMHDDEAASYRVVGELMERKTEVDAFFFAAGGKEGGIRAIREKKRAHGMRIVTVDIDPYIRRCLADGTVAATICQQPFVQGYEPVRQLAGYLLHGEAPAEKMQYTQAEIVIRQCL